MTLSETTRKRLIALVDADLEVIRLEAELAEARNKARIARVEAPYPDVVLTNGPVVINSSDGTSVMLQYAGRDGYATTKVKVL